MMTVYKYLDISHMFYIKFSTNGGKGKKICKSTHDYVIIVTPSISCLYIMVNPAKFIRNIELHV